METRTAGIMIVAAVIAVSGCSALPLPSSSSGTTNPSEPQMVPGKGLEVSQFKVTDNTLSPGQTVQATLKLKNYHREPISIGEIGLGEGSLLSKSNKKCTPDEIKPAEKGVAPVMKCTWDITAPSSDDIGGFNQRTTSVYANIPYSANITNYQPMKLQFKPLGEVNRTDKKVMTYANSEVRVKMETESPVPLEQYKKMNFEVMSIGNGRVDGDYNFSYSPKSVFITEKKDDIKSRFVCPESDAPVLEDKLEFTCYIKARGSQSVLRNLFFTVSYKYVQAPSLDITIVK